MSVFIEILEIFLNWLKVPLIICACIVVLFYFLIYFHVAVGYLHGKRLKKSSRKRVKKVSLFHKLVIDLPKQIAEDKFNRDPDEFPYQGCIIFEGRQGRGKTIAMCEFAMRMKEEFPKAQILDNLNFTIGDFDLEDWHALVDYKNGKDGIIAMIDETQNWFSSNQSKNFPPEMLETITQNRKNRRIILGTAQNFYLLAKAIRSQATEVRRCATYFGCFTVVRRVVPILNSEGIVVEWKKRGTYCFVHNKKLRTSYDTYHVIESLSKSGFKEEQTENNTNVYVVQNKK